jgi:hypothetical protein
MLDLLITGGLVIDGSGNPGYHGAVGVEGERIRLFRGTLEGVQAHRTLDATGRVVAPRLHRHARAFRPGHPGRAPPRAQGAPGGHHRGHRDRRVLLRAVPTTEDLEAFVEINAGLDGCPPLPGRWTTVEQYLDLFTSRVAVNIVYLVGNSPLACARSAGTIAPPARPRSRTSGRSSAPRWRKAPGGCRPASTTRPGATPTRTSSSPLPGGDPARRDLPHPRALRAR